MKVIYLLDSVNVGGTETLALDVCRNARPHGIEITVVSSRGGEMEEAFRESGAEYVRLARRLPIDPLLVRDLRRIARERGIDVIHAHQAVEGLHAYLAAAGTDTKVALTHHGFVPDTKNRTALRFLLPRVDANLFVSHGLKQWYVDELNLTPGSNAAVLYNGIDEKRLIGSGGPAREELGISPEAIVFGMVANFYASPRKDQKTLCEAFASIADSSGDTHLLLVGSVEDGAESKLAECVEIARNCGLEHRIHFLGRRNDVPAILESLDVFVLSSLHEGLGIAAIEAMLLRKPCLLSDIPPLREVSGDGEAAIHFPVGDAQDLAAKMLTLATDAGTRESLAERAHDYAGERFSIAAHLAGLSEIYGRTVRRRRR